MRIRVASRFNGPPGCGNGGYSAGSIAAAIDQPVRVRLRRPIPLNADLVITPTDESHWDVHSGPELIATATAHVVSADVPTAPSRVEALGASQHYAGFAQHSFPLCFVCGPERAEGDGLRIFAGSVPGTNLFAAPWRPDGSLADARGRIGREFVWAALDCPGYFATCNPAVALLGEMSVRIDRLPHVDEPCVITAWRIGTDGRKHYAGTALFGADDQCCAFGVATWIELQ